MFDSVPRWLGWLWIAAGAVTALGALIGLVVGWVLLGTVGTAVTDSVSSARRALTAVDDTIGVVEATFDQAANSLRGVQVTVADMSLTLTQASAVTRSLGTVVTEEVPESVDAIRASLPGLMDTAGVVDATMRGLSLFGVDYAPELPLDESIERIDSSLADIPVLLRTQQSTLDSVAADLGTFSSSTLEITENLAAIRLQLAEASVVLGGYESLVSDGTGVLDDLEARVGSSITLVRVALVLVTLGLGIAQTVPIAAGLFVIRTNREPEVV